MMKKLGLAAMATSVVLLTGCGGGSTNTDNNANTSENINEQMKQRDAILIIHGANLSFCEYSEAELKVDETNDIIMDHVDNTVNCSTYGRTRVTSAKKSDKNVCLEEDLSDYASDLPDISIYEDSAKACVFGMNRAR